MVDRRFEVDRAASALHHAFTRFPMPKRGTIMPRSPVLFPRIDTINFVHAVRTTCLAVLNTRKGEEVCSIDSFAWIYNTLKRQLDDDPVSGFSKVVTQVRRC